jgi:hypothetical protein
VIRTLQPELLDMLPPDDADAMRSRRDLRRINAVMGQAGMMAARLRALPQPKTLVDLGGGDGRFLLAVARRLPWRGVTAVIADRQDIAGVETRRGLAARAWTLEARCSDVFDFLPAAESGAVVIANLFLHHFSHDDLTRLLLLAAGRASAFIALEPRRSPFALLGARLVWSLGANRVTRHDAVASVRAGFAGRELSALWPQSGWRVEEGAAFPFTHFFMALRL